MEKFGIFELLDTLAALSAPSAKEDAPKAEVQTPSQTDAVFAPPAYASEQPPPPAASKPDALAALLERHDAIRQRVKKK